MNLKVKTVCPLGCECERVVDDHIERCAWYVKLQGKNPQTGAEIDDWRCSMAWQPLLMIEATGIQSNVNELCFLHSKEFLN